MHVLSDCLYQYRAIVEPQTSKIVFHWNHSIVHCNYSNLLPKQWLFLVPVNQKVCVERLFVLLDKHLRHDWNKLTKEKTNKECRSCTSVTHRDEWCRTWADFWPPGFKATRENLMFTFAVISVIVPPFIVDTVNEDIWRQSERNMANDYWLFFFVFTCDSSLPFLIRRQNSTSTTSIILPRDRKRAVGDQSTFFSLV